MTKFLSMLMAFAILSTSAFAGPNSDLKKAYDELTYELSVEWDQNDKDFYNAKMEKFQNRIIELRSQGVTNADIMSFVKSEIKDEKKAQDIETAMSVVSINQMSPNDAANYMFETMKKSYNEGASWTGNWFLYYRIALIVVFVAIVASSRGSSSDDGETVPGGTCYSQYRCDSVCGYSYPSGYTCGPVCYWTQCF